MKKITPLIISLIVFFSTLCYFDLPVNAVEQTQITRSQVEERALAMINLKWTFSKSKNTNISTAYKYIVNLPRQLENITSGQMTGIPYNWGGTDSLDTHSYNEPWYNFLDAVSKGAYTGNVSSKGGDSHLPNTAGIDCSGFVQVAYNIKGYKLSTISLLNTYFKRIDLSQIRHMDILDYPGVHVVIFDKWGTLNGVEGAFTYESTVAQYYGGIQGTKKYFISKNSINKGYIPARYINIIEDTSISPTPSTYPHPVDTGIFAKISDKVEWVNLRSAATSSSTILSAIKKESIIYVISYYNGWYKVSYQGKEGWIWGSNIMPLKSGEYVTIKNVTALNIRSNPSSTASIVGYLSENQYAKVLGYSQDGRWINISFNNIQGWASSNYLSYIY